MSNYFEEAIITVTKPTLYLRLFAPLIDPSHPILQQLWITKTDLGTSTSEWRDVDTVLEV